MTFMQSIQLAGMLAAMALATLFLGFAVYSVLTFESSEWPCSQTF